MKKYIGFVMLGLLLFAGCARKHQPLKQTQNNYSLLFSQAKSKAKPLAKKVLQKAYELSFVKKVIVRGSCWDYINTIYHQAGFPAKKRKVIFKGEKRGSFANLDLVQPGDWLYFVNYSYHKVGHSGLFINWIDRKKRLALILSYAGENRKVPARYKVYDISSVYYIVRAYEGDKL